MFSKKAYNLSSIFNFRGYDDTAIKLLNMKTGCQPDVVVEKVSISLLAKAADAFHVGGRGSTQL